MVNLAAGIEDKGPGSVGKTDATRIPSNLSCLSRCLRLDCYVAPRIEVDFGRGTSEFIEQRVQMQSRSEQCCAMHSKVKSVVDTTLKSQIRPLDISETINMMITSA